MSQRGVLAVWKATGSPLRWGIIFFKKTRVIHSESVRHDRRIGRAAGKAGIGIPDLRG